MTSSLKIKRTYGKLKYYLDKWVLEDIEPHVSIKLKKIFPKIPTYEIPPYSFAATDENSAELEWFTSRFPLEISKKDLMLLKKKSQTFSNTLEKLDSILLPEYKPQEFQDVFIYDDKKPRHYQFQMAEMTTLKKYSLCGDTMGLGKTITGIATVALNASFGPAAIVVPQHLIVQWKEKVEEFTNLTVHIITKGTPYNLPSANIYIFKYGLLRGWTDIFAQGVFHTAIFDEAQELRTGTVSQKGSAAKILCGYSKVKLGLSGTPVYNYGGEIWNIFDILHAGCLGEWYDFQREWCTPLGNGKFKVDNPEALGTYLREQHLLIRRTKKDVGIEMGKVSRIVQTVEYDDKSVSSFEEIAKQLAITASTGSFIQRGQASRELDMRARQITGISKARAVAEIVRMLIESGEKVILTGWHREVYNIWLKLLKDFNPVMYTGSETNAQKEKAKKDFINGNTDLLILSNRSGAGLDGLQSVCSTMVIGELDWSPKVHEQLEMRIDRDGQENPIMIIYPVTNGGSDPVLMDMCGLKNSQADGIVDPGVKRDDSYGSDESRVKKLVEYYLNK